MADEAKRTGRGMREAMVTLAIFSLTIIAASPASADLSGGAYAAERGVSSGRGGRRCRGDQPRRRAAAALPLAPPQEAADRRRRRLSRRVQLFRPQLLLDRKSVV